MAVRDPGSGNSGSVPDRPRRYPGCLLAGGHAGGHRHPDLFRLSGHRRDQSGH
ncbi:UNVERIFIED_CONTAM: hypothetical protein GTU68_055080 [Idotea baltica]|nr:hypothetical protein [Idotea baltica]